MKEKMKQTDIKILDFSPQFQPDFERLNREWIERFFEMEKPDYEILQNPQQHIIDRGGFVFFAQADDAKIVGTVALLHEDEEVCKLVKLAVDENYRGHGIGEKLCLAAIEQARQLGAKKVILYSNTDLEAALRLYYRMGFIKVPLSGSDYARINIKMEYSLENAAAA